MSEKGIKEYSRKLAREAKKRRTEWLRSQGICVSCKRNEANPGTYCDVCKQKEIDRRLRYTETDRYRFARNRFRARYGVSIRVRNRLLLAQDFKCAICHQEVELETDHDHETNIIRGLLCRDCNLGLGRFHDDEQLLFNAIEYLRNVDK